MKRSILLAGVGGQGTILASKLISAAAVKKSIPVKTAETIGMAQRGGSVFSHVRLGNNASPMIPPRGADLIIGFEPAEAARHLMFLKDEGTVVTATAPVYPVSALTGGAPYDVAGVIEYLKTNVKRLILVDTERLLAEIGNSKVLNTLLLGEAIRSGALGLTAEDIMAAMKELIPEKLFDINKKALVG